MSARNPSKELVYYKFPTVVADLTIHFSVFYLLLHLCDFLHPVVSGILFGKGAAISLFMSYLIAISVIRIRLHERLIPNHIVVVRAIGQSSLAILLFIFFISVIYNHVPVKFYAIQWAVVTVLIVACHLVIQFIIQRIRKSGKNIVKVIMVGADENLVSIWKEMKSGYGVHGYSVLGFFTDKYNEQVPDGALVLGGVDDVPDYIANHQIDEIYCGINPGANPSLVYKIIHEAEMRFMQFWFVPNMNGYPHRRMKYAEFGSVNVICLRDEPLDNPGMKFIKRFGDIVISGLFLVTLYPVIWFFVAIGIKLSSPGPILFRQMRTGYNGRAFECLKFRSMKVNADADTLQATENDPRKTKFGDFLRRSSIDELPQFINVFKGDMSLIGPRPHMEKHTEIYSQLISEYMVRHLVKPGLTGWAQVNGCRGETKTVEQMKERVEHDIWYIEHWSLMLDIRIFIKTVFQILGGDKQAY
ncbi:MAG: undecaprenyl-phosphate glucose phosphotransferase [Bacteroidetes bacterium]|uniref:Undecaprenyl-phosphate glucose phosphotransferase n=1 Tax=Candidatus Cryptobacteroides excrementipullorum TaxID=2840761 RepID=A0A9D9ITK4_9BACT|nr:undecaprenyl-phosphate glucose phosphotransferase [Candidatus Cryptobacteroides excrementipullorum]